MKKFNYILVLSVIAILMALIPGVAATVYLRINGTSVVTPSLTTANGAGYYIFNGLVNGTAYDVWSQKTGYANSTVEQKLAVGV